MSPGAYPANRGRADVADDRGNDKGYQGQLQFVDCKCRRADNEKDHSSRDPADMLVVSFRPRAEGSLIHG